jgi:cation transport ATPase
LHRGQLADRRVVELGTISVSELSDGERAPLADQLARAAELQRTVLAVREIEPLPRLLGLIVLAKAPRPGATEAVRTLRKAQFTLALAHAAIDPRDQEALTALDVQAVAEWPATAIGLVQPGQPALESCAATIHFGGRARVGDGPDSEIVIARDDPRTLVDLLQFARDFRVRIRIATIAANLPGLALLAAAIGYAPASPLFVTIVALAGIVLAVGIPQALRLSPTMANEVDEE